MGNLPSSGALALPGGGSATIADLSAAGVATAAADDPKDPLAAQATIHAETLAAYLKNKTGAFGTGGVSDTYASQASIGHPEAHPMIYDTAGRPKRADYALRRQLFATLSGAA